MSAKEEATLMNAFEKYGTLCDKAMIIFMLHTGLHFGNRNKQREVPLNNTVRFVLAEYIASSHLSQSYLFLFLK